MINYQSIPMPLLSVVIPTHKRPTILKKCLEHIARQTIAGDLEVIVVSDGHDDATERFCKNFQFPAHRSLGEGGSIFNFQFFEIPKSHQGTARNRGVDRATAPLTLFIGDDIFLAPDACERHVQAQKQWTVDSGQHESSNEQRATSQPSTAVLGFTTWDPAVGNTKVMRWLECTGWQFGYPKIWKYAHGKIPKCMQHRFTYTSHLSLPTEIARKIRFREDVSLYGWEDIEWGLRLKEAGIPLYFEPDAKALHHHRITLEDSLRRMETIGHALPKIAAANPAFDRMPKGWKLFVYRLLALLPTMRGKHAKALLQGLRSN